MNFSYDPTVDALTLRLSAAPVEESDEVAPGVILDYDENGQVISIEVLDVSKRSGKAVPIQTKLETLIKREEGSIFAGNGTVRAGRLEFTPGHSGVVVGHESTSVSDSGRMSVDSEGIEPGVRVFSGVVSSARDEQMLTVSPLSFKPILRLHEVDGHNKDGPIVRYEILDEAFLPTRSGVYLVTQNDIIVYCGKFTTTFAKRWLYTRDRYVYHFKRSIISDAIAEHHKIVVYAQSEGVLREQIGQPGNEWISATSIEEKLIRDMRPSWNINGLVNTTQQDSST